MDKQDAIDAVSDAMQGVYDFDTQLKDYARAAVETLGWQPVSKSLPNFGETVVCTDGKARWLDMRHKDMPSLKLTWDRHEATHWHPIIDIASIPIRYRNDTP